MDSKASSSSTSTVSITVLFLLRVLTFVFLLIALILMITNKLITEDTDYGFEEVIKFNHILAYRYLIATIAIGFAYTIMQMALSISTLVSRKRVLSGDVGYLLDFFGDKIVSYLLISGSAAGFGASIDLQNYIMRSEEEPALNSFFEQANASASLLLIGFLFTAVASVYTSFALPKKVLRDLKHGTNGQAGSSSQVENPSEVVGDAEK